MLQMILSVWRPLIEILVIWVLIYSVIRFFQGTRAMQVLLGLLILVILFLIAKFFELNSIIWVMSKLFAVGVVAFLIIFQPEMRRALARIGTTMSNSFLPLGGLMDEILRAVDHLSRNRVGAIIAIEREMGLKTYIESGMMIDAKFSAELIWSIFDPHTPTHDGAVILSGDRIASCGSLFPLTQSTDLPPSMGTRHRAAIGITEENDAICIVISEETGNISIAVSGNLTRALDIADLRKTLEGLLHPAEGKSLLQEFIEKNKRLFQFQRKPTP
ncbi:MAG TPA: diadenylate cyclase CdaA [Candidatus Omnitrophota bacterium]|jgi:diadenylate cyclase|nr:MAG: DNA integrity scanning protein DisA [Candidatus Omnitrophica bacterium ADurb.Bin314]HOE68757.1 diadenylate cyclase CdaA [Candidatus Omnitrophota bacterium]HQB93767.1 diadenylate cyclase CdaA [Candidatus Omnitrophota bacterium]